MSNAGLSVIVPQELREKFPELIALILGSESMNDEERQYWVNILPVMTEEQRQNLRQILQNEKDQLAAIDAKYSKEIAKIGKMRPVEEIGRTRREKRALRGEKESAAEAEERRKEQEILEAIARLKG